MQDHEFLASLDAQLADAVTFLPPAMRASFHAQVGALIKLAGEMSPCSTGDVGDELDCARAYDKAYENWRTERERIRQRTGG